MQKIQANLLQVWFYCSAFFVYLSVWYWWGRGLESVSFIWM